MMYLKALACLLMLSAIAADGHAVACGSQVLGWYSIPPPTVSDAEWRFEMDRASSRAFLAMT